MRKAVSLVILSLVVGAALGAAFQRHIGMRGIKEAFKPKSTITRDNGIRRSALDALPGVPPGSIVIAGDSLVEVAEWAELLGSKSVVNRGVSSDTIEGLHSRANFQGAKVVVIEIGINDLYQGVSLEDFATRYRSLVSDIRTSSSSARVVLQSIPPVMPNLPFANRVAAANMRIERIAQDLGCEYLNIFSRFENDPRGLETMHYSDGMHVSSAGYQFWAKQLSPVIAGTRRASG